MREKSLLDAELCEADLTEIDVLGMTSVLVTCNAFLRRLVATKLARDASHARVAIQQLVFDALTRVL